jgi:hypothetical protein
MRWIDAPNLWMRGAVALEMFFPLCDNAESRGGDGKRFFFLSVQSAIENGLYPKYDIINSPRRLIFCNMTSKGPWTSRGTNSSIRMITMLCRAACAMSLSLMCFFPFSFFKAIPTIKGAVVPEQFSSIANKIFSRFTSDTYSKHCSTITVIQLHIGQSLLCN